MSDNVCNWQTKVQMNKQTNKQTKLHGAALLYKLTVPQVVKKFPALYDTQSFITMSTTAHQVSLSRARPIQSMTFQLISSKHHFNIILPSTQSVPNGLFLSYVFLLHHACHMLCPAILCNLITLILYCVCVCVGGEGGSNHFVGHCAMLPHPAILPPCKVQISFSAPCSWTPEVYTCMFNCQHEKLRKYMKMQPKYPQQWRWVDCNGEH